MRLVEMIGGPACGTRKIVPDGAVEHFFGCVDPIDPMQTPSSPSQVQLRKYVYKQELDEAGRCSRTQDGNAFRFTYRGIEEG